MNPQVNKLMKRVLINYGLKVESLTIEKELHNRSWHKDYHYKIRVEQKCYSARFLREQRSKNKAFGEITNSELNEKLKFCQHLNDHHIPFMRIVPTKEGDLYTTIHEFRFVLAEWMDGVHITEGSPAVIKEIATLTREWHFIASKYTSTLLHQKPYLDGYTLFLSNLENQNFNLLSLKNEQIFINYLDRAKEHITYATSDSYEYIIQSDLNPLNILRNRKTKICGIVDFESIGYTDRIEGLAWLIKWYSRTEGISSYSMSATLAKTFMNQYSIGYVLNSSDRKRLQSLLWLWMFVLEFHRKNLQNVSCTCN